LWKSAKASQAKNDITNAFAAAYGKDGDTIAYFGLNKWEADGDNFVGFWFFKDQVSTSGNGLPPGSPFNGGHTVGDILILADYTNGGSVASFDVYKWVGSGGNVNGTLQTVATGIQCGAKANGDACGTTNGDTETAPWPYDGRDGAPGEFPPGTFFEGGLNLTSLGLDTGCFTSFLAETRSSQSRRRDAVRLRPRQVLVLRHARHPDPGPAERPGRRGHQQGRVGHGPRGPHRHQGHRRGDRQVL